MSSKEFQKRKRRAVGTPDPDAEVVSLAAEKLLESERYVCENCNQIFQRDQNLQMHRRRHGIDWKLVKREEGLIEARKKVFVCPEPSCLHHNPCHALSDLVGIKKHFRRKHSDHKQWACDRCSKAYAVQSDYKAHLKTCGTRGHSCDCGRVFSRVESFIEHQDSCKVTCHEESFSSKYRHTILHPPAFELQLMPVTTSNSLPSSTTSPPPTSGDGTAYTQLHHSIGGSDSFQLHAQIRTDDRLPEESEQRERKFDRTSGEGGRRFQQR